MNTIRLVIEGKPKGISVQSFVKATKAHIEVLQELDAIISGEPTGTLDWFISGLSMGSCCLEAEPILRRDGRNVGSEVENSYVEGWRRIETEEASPPYLSHDTMKLLRHLTNLIGKDGVEGFRVETASDKVDISTKAAISLERLIPTRTHVLGSVEGKLETISVHGKKPRFVIYGSVTHKAVNCIFEGKELLDMAKDALGRRVNASGTVHLNIKNEPTRLDASRITLLRGHDELPSIDHLAGSDPQFTGDLTTEEFIQVIRGA